MIYLDTSVLGAIFFREPGADRVLARVERGRNKGLAISAWTLTEMASVGAIKLRTGAIDEATRLDTLAGFQHFAAANFRLIEVAPSDFRLAASMLDGVSKLRAGDALHLAVAKRFDARLASLDKRMVEAGKQFAVSIYEIRPQGD